MASSKGPHDSCRVDDADTAAAATRLMRTKFIAAVIANEKIKELQEKLSDFNAYKLDVAHNHLLLDLKF